jgi:hypothetical protein
VEISTLPFNIVASGTYVLRKDLTLTGVDGGGVSAITVTVPNVTIDFKGHTLSGNGYAGVEILANNVTVKNGTIGELVPAGESAFSDGILGMTSGLQAYSPTSYLANLHIENMNLIDNHDGIYFMAVNSSVINNCQLSAPAPSVYMDYYGIWDNSTAGGNSYTNVSFTGDEEVNMYVFSSAPIIAKDIQVGASTTAVISQQ